MANPLVIATLWAAAAAQQTPAPNEAYTPAIAEASEEGAQALASFKLPEGFVVELVAAEPLLANPVCFWPARDGSFYVAETFRLHAGVTDMREHMERLEEDMACQTVEDRVAMFKRWAGDEFEAVYGQEHERIRLLRDTDGDGQLDTSSIYADGFNGAAAGIGAGLLEHEGTLYFACIPHLWKLEDTDGDDVADQRTAISSGYGVRVTLLGHDLHGLQIGPDGWLYFSCGDRGFNVETESGRIVHPDTGAVLRCRLDGSGLEVVHTGLRNPQELAFDDNGNLFTGDNNADGGDEARWVQIVEGADSGWRSSYQWINDPTARGPWRDERLWEPHFEGQAAYILPPVANFGVGPSGVAYYPGSGTGKNLAGTFFLSDFLGSRSASGVRSFELEPLGAGFALVNPQEFIWNTLVTDVDFGPDGSIYFSDWVEGWGMTGKGRLYRAYDPDVRNSESVQSLAKLLASDAQALDLDALEELLKHPDKRARQLAQFELVRRGTEGWERLQTVLKGGSDPLASMHAAWGLGMAAGSEPRLLEYLHPFLRDPSPSVRAQTARVLGDHRYAPAASHLIAALQDEDPVVRRQAAIACARLGDKRAVPAFLQLAVKDAATDPVLRHCASWGLSRCATPEQLAMLAQHDSPQARLAAVVALRIQTNEAVAKFLDDDEPLIVLEAARAISDTPIEGALASLGLLTERESLVDLTVLRRALNANQILGEEHNARALAAFARDPQRPAALRADALDMLAGWHHPAARDYVTGRLRPQEPRGPALARELLAELAIPAVLDAPDVVLRAWIRGISDVAFDGKHAALHSVLADQAREGATRVLVFEWLHANSRDEQESIIERALVDSQALMRAAAIEALPGLDPALALPLFEKVLLDGDITEIRAVYRALKQLYGNEYDNLLLAEYKKLVTGSLRRELQLDLVEAMYARDSNVTRLRVDRLRNARRAEDATTAKWIDTLWGGDPEAGRKIFEQDIALACTRCHLTGEGAAQGVGPDLSAVSQRLSRRQLLDSIIAPNAVIPKEFESVLFVLEGGELIAGRVLEESATLLRIVESTGEIRELDPRLVSERRQDLSAMPQGLELFIKPRAMRDLIEYLSTL